MDISIILPTYNEKDNIVKLVNSIKNLKLNCSHEILIVDDNSPDGTYHVCLETFKNEKANHSLSSSISSRSKKLDGTVI